MCSLGLKPRTLVLLAPCSTVWVPEKLPVVTSFKLQQKGWIIYNSSFKQCQTSRHHWWHQTKRKVVLEAKLFWWKFDYEEQTYTSLAQRAELLKITPETCGKQAISQFWFLLDSNNISNRSIKDERSTLDIMWMNDGWDHGTTMQFSVWISEGKRLPITHGHVFGCYHIDLRVCESVWFVSKVEERTWDRVGVWTVLYRIFGWYGVMLIN